MGKKRTQSEYIEICKQKHGNKYDYSKIEYKNKNSILTIICPEHGEFFQNAHNHINGCECPKCAMKANGFNKRKSTDIFIEQAILIHGQKYLYTETEYLTANDKVKIICPEHGAFEQKPNAHITLKQGCPHCFNELRKNNAPSWKKENWVNAAKQSKIFDGFKLYLIKCFNENETFIKIGRTYTKLYKRFTQIPYKVEIIKIIESESGEYIFELEKRFKRIFKKYKYRPKIDFGGKHECYKTNIYVL